MTDRSYQPDPIEPDPFDYPVNPYQAPATPSHRVMTAGPPLAGRLVRLAAVIVDGIISLLITMPLFFFTGYFDHILADNVTLLETILMTLLGLGIFLALHGYLLATRGQTIGKMIVGVRIVDYGTGQSVSFRKLIGLRYLPTWIITMIPYFGMLFTLVDALAIFTSERRCIHDLIAGTKVVEV